MESVSDIVNSWTWLIGIISAVFLYLTYWYKRPNNFPPGPRGLPLVGYLPFFSKKIECDVYKLSKKYGPIMSVRMGPNDSVFLNDFDSIQKALVKNGTVFSGRTKLVSFEDIKKGHGIALVDYSELWKSQRRFGLMTLREFGVGKKGMENICLEELYYLNEAIRNKEGNLFNASKLLHNAVCNNICNVVFGKRFDYNDKDMSKILQTIIDIFDDPYIVFSHKIVRMVPSLKNVPPFSIYVRKLIKTTGALFVWFESMAEEHEKTYDENNIRDFIDAFIQEKRKGKDPSFTNLQLVNYIHELFVAGTETTSSTLYWAILCLLHYPETQKKLRKEITEVLGSSGSISMSKKSDMPYTCAFIQELMRFRTLVPLSLPHKTNADVNLDGHFIPKETVIFPNLWAVHNDPKLWKNPEVFDPERFLDEEGKFVNSNHVIPFSVGPRHCLGEQLARMEVFIFLVGLVQKFEFLPDHDAKKLPTIENGSGFIPIPYEVVAKEY